MAFYTYVSNVSPSDGFDRVDIALDNGQKATIRKGNSYDLSATEVARARRYVVMVSSGAGSTPDAVSYLPIKGAIANGQIPVWSSAEGAFVPGSASGGGSGGGNAYEVLENAATGWPDRPDTDNPVTWTGWTDPTSLMTNYDRFIAIPDPT